MNNADVLRLIKSFSIQEFQNLGKFLNSPYHNSTKVLVSFHKILNEFFPDFDNKNFTKENIFHILFPDKKYNDGVLRNLFSDMKKKAEEFLIFESLKNDNFHSSRIKLSEVRKRNLEKNFLTVYNSMKESLDKYTEIDNEYFYKKYLTDSELNFHMLENKMSYKVEMMSDNLEGMLNNLMQSVIGQTLRIYIQFYIVKRGNKNITFDFKYMNEIESIYKKLNRNSRQSFYINFVYCAFKVFQTGNKSYFNRLLNIKNKYVDLLNDQDKSNLYNTLIIFSYDYIVKGELKYMETLFKIMKEYVGKKLYRDGSIDHIPEHAYLNILSTGIFADEINWTEKFYQSHINKLVNTNKKSLESYSKALIAYSRNEFEKALENLAKISTKNFAKIDVFAIKYKIKSLQLKIFYEMNHNDLFYSSIDTFKHFVYNDKLTVQNNKFLVLGFLKFISKLFLLKNSDKKNTSYEKMNLRKDLLKENVIIDKIWLLKKIEEL